MYRKPHSSRTASINPKTFEVVIMFDDGFEDSVDYRVQFASHAQAHNYLAAQGFEEYDPNADLKAKGMVFINGCYRMPGA